MNKFTYNFIRGTFNVVTYDILGTEVIGAGNIPAEGPLLVVSNHVSYFDPPLIGTAMRDRLIHFMAKEELFKNPIMGWFLRYVHTFPVRRGRIDTQAIMTSFKVLKSGNVLGIFPEGTTTHAMPLGKFHTGFAEIAIRAKVPVLPAAIINSKSLPKKTGPVKVAFGVPVQPPVVKKGDKEQVRQFSEEIRTMVLKLLEENGGIAHESDHC